MRIWSVVMALGVVLLGLDILVTGTGWLRAVGFVVIVFGLLGAIFTRLK